MNTRQHIHEMDLDVSADEVLAASESYTPSDKPFMTNYRVANLDALLKNLRRAGVQVDDKMDDYGRFDRAMNPEGNRLEFWEPGEGW